MFSICSNATVALNYKEIKWNLEKVSNIQPFINKYNWKGINYLSKIDDWKTFGKDNPKMAVNILYIKEKEGCTVYISKIKLNCEKKKKNSINDAKQKKKKKRKDGIILQ